MAKPQKTEIAEAASKVAAPDKPAGQQATHVVRQEVRHENYEGIVPHPHLMKQFSEMVPDAAERFFALAEREAAHRQEIEKSTSAANISSQAAQIEMARQTTQTIIEMEKAGQTAGIAISFLAIGGAIYLAVLGSPIVACALLAMPLAGVIMALRGRRQVTPPKQDDPK